MSAETMFFTLKKKIEGYANEQLQNIQDMKDIYTGPLFDILLDNLNNIFYKDGTRYDEFDISAMHVIEQAAVRSKESVEIVEAMQDRLKIVHVGILNKIQDTFEETMLYTLERNEALSTISDDGLLLLLHYMLKKTEPSHNGGFKNDCFYTTWEQNFKNLITDVAAYRSFN